LFLFNLSQSSFNETALRLGKMYSINLQSESTRLSKIGFGMLCNALLWQDFHVVPNKIRDIKPVAAIT